MTLPDDFNNISDIYLSLDNIKGTLFFPGTVSLYKRPAYFDFIETVESIVRKKTKPVFSLRFIHEGKDILFRGQRFISVEGPMVALRRLPSIVPDIRNLNLPSNLIELLSHDMLNKGGLVIIAGETGQGKSTTAGAVIAHRAKKFSSFCLTIEDPVELPLQGFYVNDQDSSKRGVCYQIDAEELDVAAAIKDSMRCYPAVSNSILFLGETRDSLMASEVLKVANNGHLVITTFHGNDIKGALSRFISLASHAPGAVAEDVRMTMGNVFRLMIHQTISVNKLTGVKKINPKILFSENSSSMVSNNIRDNRIEMLSTELERQSAMLNRGDKLE